MKMVNGIHLHTAGGYAEGGVLDALQFLDGGGGGFREPGRGGVGEEGGDEGFVCEEKGLFALYLFNTIAPVVYSNMQQMFRKKRQRSYQLKKRIKKQSYFQPC